MLGRKRRRELCKEVLRYSTRVSSKGTVSQLQDRTGIFYTLLDEVEIEVTEDRVENGSEFGLVEG